jgi:hypothetical protein
VAIIYKIPYPNTGKAYIGSSISGREDYYGSMSERGIALMEADHARGGLPVVRGPREILWRGPADDTLLAREYATITAHRTNDPAYWYNLMPMLVGVNIAAKFNWDHNPVTHVDTTTDCPYGA